MDPGVAAVGLPVLFASVAFGSIIPVIPTGAAVSAAAVVAQTRDPWAIVLVVLVGAAGAYAGDLVTYAVLRMAGEPLAQRVGWLNRDDPKGTLARLRARIESHELRTLLLSRLIPGGRIPVLLAASLGGYPWLRFASAAVASTLLWSTLYTAIGVVGNTLLPSTTVALVVAVVAALLVTVLTQIVLRRVRRRAAVTTDGGRR